MWDPHFVRQNFQMTHDPWWIFTVFICPGCCSWFPHERSWSICQGARRFCVDHRTVKTEIWLTGSWGICPAEHWDTKHGISQDIGHGYHGWCGIGWWHGSVESDAKRGNWCSFWSLLLRVWYRGEIMWDMAPPKKQWWIPCTSKYSQCYHEM